MNSKKELIILLFILLISVILRFYNLMHDSPHFFNPDERNMAIAITRFTLPSKLKDIPIEKLKAPPKPEPETAVLKDEPVPAAIPETGTAVLNQTIDIRQ